MISSGLSAVVSAPRKKSAALMTRWPPLPIDRDLGVAGHRDARHLGRRDRHARHCRRPCRGCGSDNARRARSRPQQRMRGREPLVVLDVAPAHHARRAARRPLPIVMLLRSGSLRRSTSSDGCATRNAIIGIRLWPPAIGFASPSCEASSATASASVAGQAYSKGGNFMARYYHADPCRTSSTLAVNAVQGAMIAGMPHTLRRMRMALPLSLSVCNYDRTARDCSTAACRSRAATSRRSRWSRRNRSTAPSNSRSSTSPKSR